MKSKYKIMRFNFATNNCKFRVRKYGSIAINDKRTKASKLIELF